MPHETYPADDARSVLISVNPKAGAGSARQQVDRLAALLADRDFDTEILTDLDELSRRAEALQATGRLRVVVGVGGDGTAAEMINRTPPGTPVTLLAAGTANLLARHLGLEPSPEAMCETIVRGRILRLDAGLANGRLFSLMIGCGFDAEVVARLDALRTGHIGIHSYVRPILSAIARYGYPEMKIEWLDAQTSAPSRSVGRWFFGFNLPCYAMLPGLGAGADATDGLLDTRVFGRGSLWRGLRYVWAGRTGRFDRMADCSARRTRRVRITADEEVRFQLDGDPGGLLPVEVEVLPGRMTMLVPPTD
ncbi:MAG: protein BmrU [Pirellulales bacterium]|nr:protein BmrU [Pirellulales bacterium]